MYSNNTTCENKVAKHFKNLNIEDNQYDTLSYIQIARNVQQLHFGSENVGKQDKDNIFPKMKELKAFATVRSPLKKEMSRHWMQPVYEKIPTTKKLLIQFCFENKDKKPFDKQFPEPPMEVQVISDIDNS